MLYNKLRVGDLMRIRDVFKKKMNLQIGYIITAVIITVLLTVGCFSYAMFTTSSEKEGTFNIVTGDLYSLMESDAFEQEMATYARRSVDLNPLKRVVVAAGETKQFVIELMNVNSIESRLNLYYTSDDDLSLVKVGYTSNGDEAPKSEGSIFSKYGEVGYSKNISIAIMNQSTSEVTISFGSDAGLKNSKLVLPDKTFGLEMLSLGEPIVDTLLLKANASTNIDYTSSSIENKKEMYTFTHSQSSLINNFDEASLVDYRYIGNDVNNYLAYNGELWRIIGIFTVENEDGTLERKVKIVRNSGIGSYSWDSSSSSSINSGNGINAWNEADLNKVLNGGVYWNQSSGNCFTSKGNEKNTCDFTGIGLSDISRSFASKTKYYLGSKQKDATALYGTGSDLYQAEREENLVKNPDDKVKRDSTWVGNVGLMYPSDYIYTFAYGVENTCFTNIGNCTNANTSWIYEGNKNSLDTEELGSEETLDTWLISPGSQLDEAFMISKAGSLSVSKTSSSNVVRPVIYLSSKAAIYSGTGEKTNPYILG